MYPIISFLPCDIMYLFYAFLDVMYLKSAIDSVMYILCVFRCDVPKKCNLLWCSVAILCIFPCNVSHYCVLMMSLVMYPILLLLSNLKLPLKNIIFSLLALNMFAYSPIPFKSIISSNFFCMNFVNCIICVKNDIVHVFLQDLHV